ncbi:MAG: LpqB family beta-propeller domain-containing protein [Actinomycetaceae bacterium]|nr:LpqB family beta-propeller domain-containing protein [Actinomycetaceae bacterium]
MKRSLTVMICLAFMLAGCQSLPTSGPVTAFEQDLPDSESLVLKGFGPVADAPPEVIVRDFLRASAAGWSDDFQVARTYLTDDAVKNWKPEAQVQIYSDAVPPLIGDGQTEVTIETRVEAIVTPDGMYTPQVTPSTSSVTLSLTQDDADQWRISDLPDGTIISQSSFHAAYQLASVNFLTPDGEALVSDPRWFPRRRLASHLMQAIIEGPSPAIQSAVLSAVPEGARLPLQSVEISDGGAEVEVEGQALASQQQKMLFKWQVNSTLLQVPTVSDVHIRVNGQSLDDVKLPNGPTWMMNSMVGMSDEGITVEEGRGRRVVLSADDLTGKSITDIAIGPVDSSPIAYIEDDTNLVLLRDGSEPEVVATAEEFSAPSVDRLGWVWTVSNSRIIVASHQTDSISIESPWKSGDQLTALAISPDGARVLLQRDGASASLWVASVKRSQNGIPVGLDVPRRVEGITGTVIDMSWAGNTSATAVVRDGDDWQLLVTNLSSIPDALRAPDNVTRVSGGASTQQIVVHTSSGETYTRSGNAWRLLTTDIRYASYPR